MAKPRIVLIEDSDSEVWLFQKFLESIAGEHDLIVLKDGQAALNFMADERDGVEPRPCVIVLDFYLPKYDGLEILVAMRRVPALQHVTALVVSSKLSPTQEQQIGELAVPYAEKPNSLAGYEALAKQVWALCESNLGVVV